MLSFIKSFGSRKLLVVLGLILAFVFSSVTELAMICATIIASLWILVQGAIDYKKAK